MSAPTPALLAARLSRSTAPRHAVPRPALVARLNEGLAAGRMLTHSSWRLRFRRGLMM